MPVASWPWDRFDSPISNVTTWDFPGSCRHRRTAPEDAAATEGLPTKVIAHQLDAYNLRNDIDPIKAGYAASMADALARYKNGNPIFFYTWTPNWTVGVLKPGKDVVWIEVDHPDLPADQKDLEDKTTISGVTGCVHDPCAMGWPANDIRPVANRKFLAENPAVWRLLEEVRVPIQDIFAQNDKMNAGADSQEDIERQAKDWIAHNREMVDAWLDSARKAAEAYSM